MSSIQKSPTAILMMNLGGPATLADVEPFLLNLFADHEIIPLPWQSRLGPWIARKRAPKVRERYASIGGGSPILSWTQQQGEALAARLDTLSPETSPHKAYVAFRYSPPSTEDALKRMQADGVQRVVAFSQYPQYSCATSGASYNELWREIQRLGMEKTFSWSLVDRWPVDPGFIQALAQSIQRGLEQIPAELRRQTLILFSAHSLPLSVVDRGDPYPQEIGATVQAVVKTLPDSNPYLLCYQSAVGRGHWLGPGLDRVLQMQGLQKYPAVLVVPISFTSDHIETLYEIDIEAKEIAQANGIGCFQRAPSLNLDPTFLDGMADLLAKHLASGELCSPQYRLRCPGCPNPICRTILNPVGS